MCVKKKKKKKILISFKKKYIAMDSFRSEFLEIYF